MDIFYNDVFKGEKERERKIISTHPLMSQSKVERMVGVEVEDVLLQCDQLLEITITGRARICSL